MKVVYIHGFQSSSKAKKAQILDEVISKNYPDISFEAPDFPDNIKLALSVLEKKVESWLEEDESVCLVGSSMGGFLSILLSIKYPVKIALINPCLNPQDFCIENKLVGIAHQIMRYYSSIKSNMLTFVCISIKFTTITIVSASIFSISTYRKNMTKVYLQTGDTVLDYTIARDFFTDCPVSIEEGGCHGYDNFDRIVPDIIDFFKV